MVAAVHGERFVLVRRLTPGITDRLLDRFSGPGVNHPAAVDVAVIGGAWPERGHSEEVRAAPAGLRPVRQRRIPVRGFPFARESSAAGTWTAQVELGCSYAGEAVIDGAGDALALCEASNAEEQGTFDATRLPAGEAGRRPRCSPPTTSLI
jgi:hypothetical protein